MGSCLCQSYLGLPQFTHSLVPPPNLGCAPCLWHSPTTHAPSGSAIPLLPYPLSLPSPTALPLTPPHRPSPAALPASQVDMQGGQIQHLQTCVAQLQEKEVLLLRLPPEDLADFLLQWWTDLLPQAQGWAGKDVEWSVVRASLMQQS